MSFTQREKALILEVVSNTEATTFNGFLLDYADTPEKGDKSNWAALFGRLEELQRDGLLEVTREESSVAVPVRFPRILTLQLTEEGAQWVRDFRKVHFSE